MGSKITGAFEGQGAPGAKREDTPATGPRFVTDGGELQGDAVGWFPGEPGAVLGPSEANTGGNWSKP